MTPRVPFREQVVAERREYAGVELPTDRRAPPGAAPRASLPEIDPPAAKAGKRWQPLVAVLFVVLGAGIGYTTWVFAKGQASAEVPTKTYVDSQDAARDTRPHIAEINVRLARMEERQIATKESVDRLEKAISMAYGPPNPEAAVRMVSAPKGNR